VGAALLIEPLGSIICWRNKPEVAERSQVISPQMIDVSGSIISAGMVHCLTPRVNDIHVSLPKEIQRYRGGVRDRSAIFGFVLRQMIDPSGSMISAAAVSFVASLQRDINMSSHQ
jgi:hypothetical protein